MHDVEGFRRRTLELHGAKVWIGLLLNFRGGEVRLDDAVGIGGTLRRELAELHRLARRRLDVGEPRQQEKLREVIERQREADQRYGDGGKGLPCPDLAAEPDAHKPDHCNDDGEDQAADGYGEKVERGGRGERAEAMEQHGQNEELHEEERHAARPQPLMHRLLQIDRNHA